MKDHLQLTLFAGLMILLGTEANAMTTALGKPVEAIGSDSQAVPTCGSGACYNTGTGAIGFYIPLNSADNGIYGIDLDGVGPKGEAGTFSDSKVGPFINPNALTMYLRFTPIAPFPLATAVLTFSFVDLDLKYVNDPNGFTETIQFFSATNSALTSVITTSPASGSSPLAYTVTGNSTSQTIAFSDIRSIITTDPFYVKLVFGSKEKYSGTYRNTIEYLTATLTTSTVPTTVPEPTSMVLLGSGLIALGAWRRAQR
jgi:hypothetical protein